MPVRGVSILRAVNRGLLLPLVVAACSGGATAQATEPDAATPTPDAPDVVDTSPVEISALGVQGFVLRRGHDVVMTAPLFTRQSAFDVALDLPIESDTAAIDAGLADVPMDELRAVISGHAHYDHFLDVPRVLADAPGAVAYTNLTGRHLLAALAPDRPGCSNVAPTPTIARDRVIALDDPLASHVDYTNCPDQRPAGAPIEGSWVNVPNSHVRLMPLCSMHPAQIGPYHFGEGSIDQDRCDLPAAASGWLEGQTLSYLVDFLDDRGQPVFRVFYEDAPTNAPIGHVPPALLADKQVDVAILCVGSSDAVEDYPGQTLANVEPRFALSGHWEDFFQPLGATPQPLPLLDVNAYTSRAEAALPGSPDTPMLVDGAPFDGRHVLVQPGTEFVIPVSR